MRTIALLEIAVAASISFWLSSCGRGAGPEEKIQHYETRGIVRGVSRDRKTIDIQHEDIPGFMPSMTMPFTARDQKAVAGLQTGEAISFRLTVTDKDFWIDRVKKIRTDQVRVTAAEIKPSPASNSSDTVRLGEGDEIPFFTLTNQKNERITRDTFRGQPFVLTFIFTRCPIPNFCPRMSNQFSELQSAIKSGKERPGQHPPVEHHARSRVRYSRNPKAIWRGPPSRSQNLEPGHGRFDRNRRFNPRVLRVSAT